MDERDVHTAFPDRPRLVELVRKWAEINTDGILDKTTQIFSVPHIEGVIGYRIQCNHAVVYGDPVCASEHKVPLAKEFERHCRMQQKKVVYIIVSEEFANLAKDHLECALIEFGRKFILDPINYIDLKISLLRKKVRQSTQKGTVVYEYKGNDARIEESMVHLARQWQDSRKGMQVYLAEPTLFNDRLGKRWFYAEHDGKIIGLLLLNELQLHQGWLLNNVMVAQGSPSGVSEHLVVSALQTLEKEQCRRILIGPVPASNLGKIVGLGNFITIIAGFIFKFLKKICHLEGHEVFWEKFAPELSSSYLLFPKKGLRISTIISILRALHISLRYKWPRRVSKKISCCVGESEKKR